MLCQLVNLLWLSRPGVSKPFVVSFLFIHCSGLCFFSGPGTTAQGLLQLEGAAIRAAFIRAVQAATEKSIALGKPKL